MAMFDKHKGSKQTPPPAPAASAPQKAPGMSATAPAAAPKTAMIGQGISISGDVMATSNLKVEGQIEGRAVQSSHDVEVGESGKVSANISAKVVKIAGEVSGDVAGSEKVLISRSGRVQGNIIAPRVQLEDGALFRGSIDMNPASPDTEEKAAPARPAADAKSGKSPAPVKAQGQAASAAAGRKEPSLTLKSG